MLRAVAGSLIVALLVAAAPALAQSTDRQRTIEVKAQPITAFAPREPSLTRFGNLEFRGGLVLTSPDKAFGGLSSLHIAADGHHFLSASDRGQWLRGELRTDGVRPTGIVNAEMAPMLAANGRPLRQRGWYDTESMTTDGGTVYVGIERVNRIVRFDYGKQGLKARAVPVAVPAGIGRLPNNKGLEALVYVPHGRPLAGTLIAFAERALDAAGNHTAFLIGGPQPGSFAIKRYAEFDISDATLLPSGDVLLLERSFNWVQGVRIRIRRIAAAQIKPGAVVDGPLVLDADMSRQIDNMEGISAHRAGKDTVLTLVSDDNFSPIQRTLLLQFKLVE
jgi:hypothetical protein